VDRSQLQTQIAAILIRLHRNLRRIWAAIAIVTVCNTCLLVAAVWGGPGGLRAGVGFGGLAVVAVLACWFILRLGEENERVKGEVEGLGRELRDGRWWKRIHSSGVIPRPHNSWASS
jgi:hypothetical protein